MDELSLGSLGPVGSQPCPMPWTRAGLPSRGSYRTLSTALSHAGRVARRSHAETQKRLVALSVGMQAGMSVVGGGVDQAGRAARDSNTKNPRLAAARCYGSSRALSTSNDRPWRPVPTRRRPGRLRMGVMVVAGTCYGLQIPVTAGPDAAAAIDVR
jgi:hypothetical protein